MASRPRNQQGPSDRRNRQATPLDKPKRNIQTTEDEKNTFEIIAMILSTAIVVITFPISIFVCMSILKEFQRAVIFRLGRVRKGVRGPGIIWLLPCIDKMTKVDLRTAVMEVPPQDVLTKDSVTICVDAVLYYSIYSPMDAVIQVAAVRQATLFLAQTTLRNVVGSKPLIELLTSRETLSREIGHAVHEATEPWGIRVERVELKDISLPESLQRALASEAEAHREARAKIISAEGELNAAKALKEASDVMATNKITLQLRHLQILTSIATERHCRIIFPFPMDIMTPFEEFSGGSGKKKDDDKQKGNPAGNDPAQKSAPLLSLFSKIKTEEDNSEKPQINENQINPNDDESRTVYHDIENNPVSYTYVQAGDSRYDGKA